MTGGVVEGLNGGRRILELTSIAAGLRRQAGEESPGEARFGEINRHSTAGSPQVDLAGHSLLPGASITKASTS